MQQDNEQNTQRSSEDEARTFERRPKKIDVDEFGPWIIERDRKVFEMLAEYDRRQKKRKADQG